MRTLPVLSTTLMLGWAASTQGQNLIQNPGFEAGTPSNYWSLWKDSSAAGAQAAVTYPSTGAHQGSRYARVDVTAPATENWHIQLQIPPDWVADSGVTYELKFWAKSDSSRSIHVGIQDGPDGQFAYRSGMDFSLTPEWNEYSLTYTSDHQGNGTVRFNLYLGLNVDTYGFDDFSLLAQEPVVIRGQVRRRMPALRVKEVSGQLALALEGGESKGWKAELFNLRGVKLGSAERESRGGLALMRPAQGGTYLIRVTTPHSIGSDKIVIP